MTPPAGTPDLVVLEPAPRGHGREWLLHLAAHARRCDPVPRLAFVVAAPVAEALTREMADDPVPGLSITALGDRELTLCTDRRLAVSAVARWWTMRRHLRATGARHGLFLEFDHLTLPLAFGLPVGRGRAVSGILFRPSVHYRDGRETLGERLRDLRKEWLYRLTLRRAAVQQVHTLDQGFPAFARARYRGGDKVTALADPAHPPLEPTADDRVLAARSPSDRKLFVLFGVLSERKGVLALLRSLALLEPQAARHTAVIVAGEVEASIRAQVDALSAAVSRRPDGPWLHLEPRFLRSGEIAALIDRAHVVLAPYQRFVGSSGVLMWAASRDRPVISQDYGLVGQLVREHGLGLTADTSDPADLARAVAVAAGRSRENLSDSANLAAFARGLTPEVFAAAILAPVCREARHRETARQDLDAPSATVVAPPARAARTVTD